MKKLVGLFLAAVLFASALLAGCGNTQETEEVVEEAPKILHIYSDSDEISKVLEYVWEKNPEWKERVEFVTLPENGFAEAVDAVVADKENEKCPDIIVSKNAGLTHFTESEYTEALLDLGFEDNDFEQMYSYTKEAATDGEGKIKGITWKASPGAFVYRKSIAQECFGASDADNVQSFIKDWDTMIDTARAIGKKTSGEIKIIASVKDIDKAFGVDLWSDRAVSEDLQNVSAVLEKNKFTAGLEVNSDAYYNAANQGTIFGYFCDMNTLGKLEMRCKVASKDDWGVCSGPQGFVTSGEWLFVTKVCEDREFAAQLIKSLCTDEAVLTSLFENENIFANNSVVMTKLAKVNKGKLDFIGGNDYIRVFDKAASKLEMPEKIEVVAKEEAVEGQKEAEADSEDAE